MIGFGNSPYSAEISQLRFFRSLYEINSFLILQFLWPHTKCRYADAFVQLKVIKLYKYPSIGVTVVERRLQYCWCDPASPLVPRRPTIIGGNPFPCLISSSPYVPIGRAGGTLLGGLLSMLKLGRVWDGVIAWKSSRYYRSLVNTRYELPGSQRDGLVQNVYLDLLELLTTWAVSRSWLPVLSWCALSQFS